MRSSISILLLAPDAWARGCGPWFTLPSVACPVGRSHSCCCSVSSLCSTCCHPGIEEWRCACARSCVAPASGLWFLGASLPSTGFVVAVQVWACPVLLAWAVPCFSLGAWALGQAASSVAFRPSPSLGSVRRLVFLGSVSTSWESLVPYSVAFDSFSSSSSLHLSARALPEERVGVLV